MTAPDEHEISAEERGDTATPRRKVIVFAAVVAVIAAAVVGIALASDVTADDAPAPTRVTAAPRAAPEVASDDPATADVAQAELVDAEDTRIFRAVARGTMTRRGVKTVVLDRRDAGAYGIGDLVSLGAATRKGRTITVTRPVVVRTGAALEIKAPGRTLRLAGTAKAPASIVAWGGSLTLSGRDGRPLKIVGWDRRTKAPDQDVSDGRGYVRSHSGRLTVKHVSLDSLGFWSGRTGGLAATGTSFDPGSARISDSSITASHIGLYLVGTRNARVARTTVTGAARDGIELDRSRGTRLTDVTVSGSGVNGIRAHDHSTRLRITRGASTDNAGHGISVDGQPQADGPNANGYNVVNASGLAIVGTRTTGNVRGGVQVAGTSAATLLQLRVDEDRRPVRIVGRSTSTTIVDSTLTSGRGPVVEIADRAKQVRLRGNTLTGTTTGVAIADAEVDVADNTIGIVKGHAVSVDGAGAAGTIGGNHLTGAGTRAVEVSDVAAKVVVRDNDAAEWETTHPLLDPLDEGNPFAPLWVAILLVPAVGVVFIVRRIRNHRDLRRLTEETVIAMTKARRHGTPAVVPTSLAAPSDAPEAPVSPAVGTATATLAPPAPPVAVPAAETAPVEVTRTDRLVTRGTMGQFGSAEDLAIHAVLQGGKSPLQVARTLQVPVAVVDDWVRRALDRH